MFILRQRTQYGVISLSNLLQFRENLKAKEKKTNTCLNPHPPTPNTFVFSMLYLLVPVYKDPVFTAYCFIIALSFIAAFALYISTLTRLVVICFLFSFQELRSEQPENAGFRSIWPVCGVLSDFNDILSHTEPF